MRDAQGRAADAAGRSFSPPDSGPVDLGQQPQRVTSASVIHQPGTYSYVLEYRVGEKWTVLPPYNTITVR